MVNSSHPALQTERAEACFSDMPPSFYNNSFLVPRRTVWGSRGNRSRELSCSTQALWTSRPHPGPPSRLGKQVSSSCGFTGVNLSPREVLSTSCLLYGCRKQQGQDSGQSAPKAARPLRTNVSLTSSCLLFGPLPRMKKPRLLAGGSRKVLLLYWHARERKGIYSLKCTRHSGLMLT